MKWWKNSEKLSNHRAKQSKFAPVSKSFIFHLIGIQDRQSSFFSYKREATYVTSSLPRERLAYCTRFRYEYGAPLLRPSAAKEFHYYWTDARKHVKFIRNYIPGSRVAYLPYPHLPLLVQKYSCLYNKKKITEQREDMKFIFEWYHPKIKFISSRPRVISDIYVRPF